MEIDEECIEKTTAPRIKVEEMKKKAVIINDGREEYTKIKIDGCVVRNRVAADWMLMKDGVGTVIIELKGKDVEHALRQVKATAILWNEEGALPSKVAALIVGSFCPKVSSTIQKAQAEFARKFKGPIHIVSRQYEGCFEAILSFKGPHKL